MDDLCRPQGRYPECFLLISSLELCQEGGGVKKGGTWRTLRILDHKNGEQSHPLMSWMMLFYPEEDYLKVLC